MGFDAGWISGGESGNSIEYPSGQLGNLKFEALCLQKPAKRVIRRFSSDRGMQELARNVKASVVLDFIQVFQYRINNEISDNGLISVAWRMDGSLKGWGMRYWRHRRL